MHLEQPSELAFSMTITFRLTSRHLSDLQPTKEQLTLSMFNTDIRLCPDDPKGLTCLPLQVPTRPLGLDIAAWKRGVVYARLFPTGTDVDWATVQLSGCRSYEQAVIAFNKVLDLIQPTLPPGSERPSLMEEKTIGKYKILPVAVGEINAAFNMPPFSRDVQIPKVDLNDLARDEGISVLTGGCDGKPYIRFVLHRPPISIKAQAMVYMSGAVRINSCNSMAHAIKAAHFVQSFVDKHAEKFLDQDDEYHEVSLSSAHWSDYGYAQLSLLR